MLAENGREGEDWGQGEGTDSSYGSPSALGIYKLQFKNRKQS